MQLSDFNYELPDELIAKFPEKQRTMSRLMVTSNLDGAPSIKNLVFENIIDLINPGDLLILNNTKVMPARFYGNKVTGAKIEFLLERVLDHGQALVYIKANKTPKPGLVIDLTNTYSLTVLEKQHNLYLVELNQNISWFSLLEIIGKLPLPPYINRDVSEEDEQRYQTVYAQNLGAVAAPTAGLHFDNLLLNKIKAKGVDIKYITLHVGSGTFLPVRVDNILEHKMHSESYKIDEAVIKSIIALKVNNHKNHTNNKIIAVGTTTLRCLEAWVQSLGTSACVFDERLLNSGRLYGDTEIFIYPGFQFRIVDSLITNFHLPGSTLLMLVSAFSGISNIRYYYQQAIAEKYRFFSYGDAMWLNRLP